MTLHSETVDLRAFPKRNTMQCINESFAETANFACSKFPPWFDAPSPSCAAGENPNGWECRFRLGILRTARVLCSKSRDGNNRRRICQGLPLGKARKHFRAAVHCGPVRDGSGLGRARMPGPRLGASVAGLSSLSYLQRLIVVSRGSAIRKLCDLLKCRPIRANFAAPNPADRDTGSLNASRDGIVIKFVQAHVFGQVHNEHCTPCVQR